MRIAIVGAGALGLYYGALLARVEKETGSEVHFLMRSDYQTAIKNGIQIHSIDGDFAINPARAYQDSKEIGPVDLILIGLKTTANQHYKQLIEPLFQTGHTRILCLQNGIGNERRLAQIFGAEHIIGGVAFLCSNRISPATIEHIMHGAIAIAAYNSECRFDVSRIAELMQSSGIHCSIMDDYTKMRWRKQVWNVTFNGLCTIHNTGTAHILAEDSLKNQVRLIMGEVIDLGRIAFDAAHKIVNHDGADANPNGIDTTAASRLPHYDLGADLIEDQIHKTEQMDDYLPSMLLDYRAKRPLESDSIIYSCLRIRDHLAPEMTLPAITRLADQLRALEN